MASVQFLLDGANLGNPVAVAPFSLQWNTATATIGTHTLSAIAKDYAGNTATSTSLSVTVTNPTAGQIGQWTPVMNWPIVAVHAMLLPTGDVLAWTDYTDNAGAQIWRPATNTFTPKTYSTVSLFCSAHSYLADGRLIIPGGIVGLQDDLGPRNATVFDPVTESWSQAALMNVGRYYPTSTTLGDGRILVMGGTTTCVTCIADTPEIYDPVADKWTLLAASAKKSFKYYPHTFVLPDGRILVGSEDDKATITQVLDLNTQSWTTIDSRVTDGHSAVMFAPGKILKAGTATADAPGFQSASTSYMLDMSQPSPAWQATGSMAYPRSFLNLTVLPDGQVLATGGGTTTDPANFATAVYPAELWSPVSKTWTTMSAMQTPRLYHSTAVLMPDARVLVAGGGRQNGRSQPDPKDEPNAEIFSPPYLFKGPRPVISSAPTLVPYGTAFSVLTPDASRIGSVSLIALSAVTHAFNENQRFVPLQFEQATGGLTVHAPVDGNTAPPGPYMLFILDTNGVPSIASMVRMPAPSEDIQPPTAPGNLSALASTGLVNLTWSASSDNVGVTGYNIHRSTVSGFVPTSGNKIGQAFTHSYNDIAFAVAGTYFYVVTAQDAKGNVSAPSNETSASVALDTTPPSVSLTSPTVGSTLSGIVNLQASASDDVTVAGVQFLLDGINIGNEVTGPGPIFTFSWNTLSIANGSHTLSARARDGAGNATNATDVQVSVSNVVPSGLVAAYSFGEGSGTTVVDASVNNITATIVGATWTTAGKFGNALSFNGTNSYVDLGNPAALQLTGSITLEAWVKAAATPPDDGQIVAKSNSSGWELKTTPDTGPHTFGVGVSGTSTSKTQRYSTTVRALNTWYHVAGVYDATAGTLSTYVNGVLDNGTLKGTIPTSQFNQNVNVNIGRRTGGFYFNGVIDEVRIYKRALSQAEIQNDMNTPVGGTPPPDTTPPSVSITTPVAGANVLGTINVTASASDNVGMAGVQFLLDGTNLGVEVTGPGPTYSLSWNTTTVGNGPHVLSARARDAANNATTAANISISVSNDTTQPTISLTAPADGATLNGTVSVTASATDNVSMAGVQFLLDGVNLGTEVLGSGPSYTFNWNTNVTANGTHALSARARDTSNNHASTTSISVTVSNPDTTAPVASLTAPAAGAVVSGNVNVSASATDNVGVAGLQFLLDGANLGVELTVPGPSYTMTWPTTGTANGLHILSARARDAANNVTISNPVNVTVTNGDLTPPTVSLTSPGAGATVNGNVGLTASATDNVAMAGVQFLLDGTNLGAEVTGLGPTYTFNWDTTTAANGPHTLSARARDVSNNMASATSLSVNISNAAPTGLLVAYSFNQGSGTTAADSSGNAVTGTLSGTTWTTAGKYSNALSFNGTSSYVNLGNPALLQTSGSMTFTAWIKATGTPSDDGQIISRSNGTAGWQFKTSPDTGPHTFAVGVSSANGASAQRYSTTVRQLNVWYHVAGVYNASAQTLDIYVNGVLDNGVLRGTIPSVQTLANVNVNIGRRTGGFYFKGIIDEVRVYNRALSQAEIQSVMNTPLP